MIQILFTITRMNIVKDDQLLGLIDKKRYNLKQQGEK